MKTKHVVAPGLLALTLTFGANQSISASLPPPDPGPFQPGEILVNELFGSSVQRYSATGTLLQTFTGTGTVWDGASLTPDGNLVTSYRSPGQGLNIFNPAGTQITTFAATGNSFPQDVSVFSNGTLALCDYLSSTVQFWSQAGVQGSTVTLPEGTNPSGSTVGSDGILYVGGFGNKTLVPVSADGVSLGAVSLTFVPGDLVMNPVDGTLWVSGASNGMVEHITTTGTLLGFFPTGLTGTFAGIGLAPDDNSLYVTSTTSAVVKQFGIAH